MNILPKKSWHVRNKKNIERVRRDEAEAARIEGIEKDRILRAEQEARIRELQARAGVSQLVQAEHINLFQNTLDHQQTTNKDYEREKREEDAKWQQKVGLINKLVKSDDVNKPWYCDKRSYDQQKNSIGTSAKIVESMKISDNSRINHRASDSTLRIYDPMTAIIEAERKAKEKQSEELRRIKNAIDPKEMTLQNYEFYKTVPPPRIPMPKANVPSGTKLSLKKPVTLAKGLESDSSPEIVKIVTSRDKRKAEKRKVKKHKSKKSKNHHNSHKHHRHKRSKHK